MFERLDYDKAMVELGKLCEENGLTVMSSKDIRDGDVFYNSALKIVLAGDSVEEKNIATLRELLQASRAYI